MITRAPRISPRKLKVLIQSFADDDTADSASRHAKVSRPCANRWYRHFRELIYRAHSRAPRFAGDVEIDQVFFGGRGNKKHEAFVRQLLGRTRKQVLKKMKKKRPEKRTEVVCFFLRGGGVYTHIVERSDERTMLPLIRLVVEPGSAIYTDKWPAFNPLKADGYKHYAINHSHEYRDRRGRHINGVDRFVSFSKMRLIRFFGVSRSTMPLHIRECQWRWNIGAEDWSLPKEERRKRTLSALVALMK